MTTRLLAFVRALVFIVAGAGAVRRHFPVCRIFGVRDVSDIVDGAFLRPGALLQSLRWAMPLFITAIGVAISFRCGYFNIGAQGQFYIGAICATFMATWLNDAPAYVLTPLCFLAGMAGGALWAFWPGWLRLRSGTDEVITTLMGNFIAGLILVYVTTGPLKDPSGTGQQSSSRPLKAPTGSAIPWVCRRSSSPSRWSWASSCGCWSIAPRSASSPAWPAATRRW